MELDELVKGLRGEDPGDRKKYASRNGEEIYRPRDRLNLLIENNTLKFHHGFGQGQ